MSSMESILRIHYLLVGWAGHQIQLTETKGRSSSGLLETQAAMLTRYQQAVDLFFASESPLFTECERPSTLVKDNLLTMKGDGISGASLWRKFGELKTYVLNSINPAWLRAISSAAGASNSEFPGVVNIDEALIKVREELWQIKQENGLRKRIRREIQAFHIDWYPKEWLVFIHCGLIAANKALSCFVGSNFVSGTLSHPKPSNGHVNATAATISMHQPYGSQPLHNIFAPMLLAPIHPPEHLMMPAANGQYYLSGLPHQQPYHTHQQQQHHQHHLQHPYDGEYIVQYQQQQRQQQQQHPSPQHQQQQVQHGHHHHQAPTLPSSSSHNSLSRSNTPHQQAIAEGKNNHENNDHGQNGHDLSSHGGLDAYALSQLQIMAQSQQQHHNNTYNPMRYSIPPPVQAPVVTAFDHERLRALQENNSLMRYDLELKRLEKLMQRAISTQKPRQYVDQLQEMIDLHLEKGVPALNG